MQKKLRDFGIKIGHLDTGPLNKITDVTGVTVGHSTIKKGAVNTGVTAIHPRSGNVFENKVVGASYVMNGFGKTIGTIQINELGTIETPILLTNTLSVGECVAGLLAYMTEYNPSIGNITGTVNPVVCECNDMFINDIRTFAVKKEHVFQALHSATADFIEGGIGAGTGMRCFGLKGGIGSSSRILTYPHGSYTLGALVLSNFGQLQNLLINGNPAGERIAARLNQFESGEDRGSIIVIIATDLPVSSRQLRRMIKRASVGLIRTGSFIGNGSGDIFIGFSTANDIPHSAAREPLSIKAIHESDMEQAFIGVAEATEEAILNSLITAEPGVARNGERVYSLQNFTRELY
ncbi:S58 family peptidase [Sporolactobacillus sp. THM7-4]|nr:S58 family peptidase [Sporolactobacillus sp. THM7-4]